MFEGFASKFVDTGDASIFTRYGGDGPAVLLLHGHPRTSATWHRVAPLLADRGFSVVCHDRGSCVALRLALDSPREVTTLTLLDGIPITEHLDRITDNFAIHYWHWFFFAQPEIPERVINADPDAWYHGNPAPMGAENYDEWRAATRNPEVVRAMLEDYRAGLTIDRRHEEADRAAGTKLECPTLVLWSEHDDLEDL